MFRRTVVGALALVAAHLACAGATSVPIIIMLPAVQPGNACIPDGVGSGEQTTTSKGDVVKAVGIHGANATRCPDPMFPNLASTEQLAPDAARTPPAPPAYAPTELEIGREYERLLAAAAPVREYHVRHILLHTREDALAALTQIRAGRPFAEIAAAASIDNGSKYKGGDLGWNVPSSFIDEFSKSMVSLQPKGLVAEPVKTRFGWHVIEVLDTKMGKDSFPPLALVKARIAAGLRNRNAAAGPVARVPAKAVCRHMVAPVLPADAAAAHVRGTVVAEIRVVDGRVAEILKLSGPGELYAPVTDALNKFECDRLDRPTIAVQSFEF